MKSSDTTEGWTRRFCFVDFPIKFTDYPSRENERLIDREIESRLTTSESLTAIFNWVLDGYVMLRNCGYFTEPDDQLQITEEFKELSNPLLEFAKELHIDDFISNELLYVQYKYWCDESGHKPLARNSFLKRIAKAFIEYRQDLEPARGTRGERGYTLKFDT